MIDGKKVEEIRFILERAEAQIARKSEKILVEMYWEIGNALKTESFDDVTEMKQFLGDVLKVETGLFEKSYAFYQNNAIKQRALRRVK